MAALAVLSLVIPSAWASWCSCHGQDGCFTARYPQELAAAPPGVRELICDGCADTDSDLQVVTEALPQDLEVLCLNLRNGKQGITGPGFAGLGTRLPGTLRAFTLHLAKSEALDGALAHLAPGLPQGLRQLALHSRCPERFGNDTVREGLLRLGAHLPPDLQELMLDLDRCEPGVLSRESLNAVLRGLPASIQSLNLKLASACQLSQFYPSLLVSLSPLLPRQLKHLALSFNAANVTGSDLSVLAQHLPPRLESIDLILGYDCHSSREALAGGLTAIAGNLSDSFRSLQLNIRDNKRVDASLLNAFVPMLPAGLDTLYLNLRHTGADNDALEGLAAKVPGALRELGLVLSSLDVDDEGLAAIAAALPRRLRSLSLWLGKTGISSPGLQGMGRALPGDLAHLALHGLDETNAGTELLPLNDVDIQFSAQSSERFGRHAWTPLMAATMLDALALVQRLMQQGAPLTASLWTGETVLMLAAAHGRSDIIKEILGCNWSFSLWRPDEDNCTVLARDTAGLVAFDWAKVGKHEDAMSLLARANALSSCWRLLRNPLAWAMFLCVLAVGLLTLLHSVGPAKVASLSCPQLQDLSCRASESTSESGSGSGSGSGSDSGSDSDSTAGSGSVAGFGPPHEGPSAGAWVLALRASWPAWQQLLVKCFRAMEVVANGLLPMRYMASLKPAVFLPCYGLLLLLPAVLTYGWSFVFEHPAVVLASTGHLRHGPGRWRIRAALGTTLCLLRFVALSWAAESAFVLQMYNARLKELYLPVATRWLLTRGFNFPAQEAEGLLRRGERRLQLPFLAFLWQGPRAHDIMSRWYALMRGTGALWQLAVGGLVLNWAFCVASSGRSAEAERRCDEHEARIKALASQIDALKGLGPAALKALTVPDGFSAITPQGAFEVKKELALAVLDIALDANTCVTLLLNEDYAVACLLLLSNILSTIWVYRKGHSHRAAAEEYHQAVSSGVPTDALLALRGAEKGIEAPLALLSSAYALAFAVKTPFQALTGVLSLLSSCYGVGGFLFDSLDTTPEPRSLAGQRAAGKPRLAGPFATPALAFSAVTGAAMAGAAVLCGAVAPNMYGGPAAHRIKHRQGLMGKDMRWPAGVRAKDWRLTNREALRDPVSVSEMTFYSDTECRQQIKPVRGEGSHYGCCSPGCVRGFTGDCCCGAFLGPMSPAEAFTRNFTASFAEDTEVGCILFDDYRSGSKHAPPILFSLQYRQRGGEWLEAPRAWTRGDLVTAWAQAAGALLLAYAACAGLGWLWGRRRPASSPRDGSSMRLLSIEGGWKASGDPRARHNEVGGWARWDESLPRDHG